MNKEELLWYYRSRDYTEKEALLFEAAANFTQKCLENKRRLSGEPFYEHNFRVGRILVENNAAPEVVLAGLLHRLPISLSEIKEKFGEEVYTLLAEMEEVREMKTKDTPAETLRKILLTTVKDVRVILLKLANKLDNLRTISVLPPEQQLRIANEVLEVYAPLAYRLGIDRVRTELEDRAFRIINPRKYSEIEKYLRGSSEEREEVIIKAINLFHQITSGKAALIKIKGRPKHIYSIFKKMTQRGVPLNEQFDLYGIRIIAATEKDCYTILGLLHENFEPVEGKLKDYIANPKPNFYRSIHTVVVIPGRKMIEVQIRTPEMDEFAEEGIAAHWKYKKVRSDESFEKRVSWLKGILEVQKKATDKEFLDTAKVEVFGDSIYCYTPKGDMKELPLGATVLDFAFSVHEQVGVHATGGKVNGKFVPLRTSLSAGDIIEIITNKSQSPHRSWLKIVRSSGARQKIRKHLREKEKLPDFNYRPKKSASLEEQAVLVESSKYPSATCILAKCCSPLPGEEIVGLITKRRIISVHKPECRSALKEEGRWIKVQWKDTFNQQIRFGVLAQERSGFLADLLHTIAQAGFGVREAKAKLHGMGEMECSLSVIPRDLEHLQELVKKAHKVKGIRKMWFE